MQRHDNLWPTLLIVQAMSMAASVQAIRAERAAREEQDRLEKLASAAPAGEKTPTDLPAGG